MYRKSLILAFIMFFYAFGKNQETGNRLGGYVRDEIVEGGTLIVGIPGEPDALNPLTALSKPARDIISLIFRRLADINEDLYTFSPQLAKRWVFSPDSLKITFLLRTDVRWHDGTPFNSADVVFTYQMQTDPDVAWDGISYKENITAVHAENDSTVEFVFREKSPTMLMDAVEGYIVPKHILENVIPDHISEAEFNRKPIGTGPFQFVDWKSQQFIRLKKFEHYYIEGKPHLDRIIFQIVPDNITLWQQVRSGDIDLMEGVPPRDFIRLEEDWQSGKTKIRPVSFLGRQYDFIGWNLVDAENYITVLEMAGDEKPDIKKLLKPNNLFGNQKVRAALTMAIDRETITRVVNYGLASPMDGPIPCIWWIYDKGASIKWPYNPDSARILLSEEGWKDNDGDGILDKNGIKFHFEMATNSGNTRREQALTLIQEQLRQIGVEMVPRVFEPGYLFGRMLSKRNFDAVLIGWNVGLKVELTPLFHSASLLLPFNFVSYHSPDFDRWEEIARKSIHRMTAQNYWNKIAKQLSWDLPYTWLYYKMEAVAIHSRFKDTVMDKRGVYVNVEDWWIPIEEQTETDRMITR